MGGEWRCGVGGKDAVEGVGTVVWEREDAVEKEGVVVWLGEDAVEGAVVRWGIKIC